MWYGGITRLQGDEMDHHSGYDDERGGLTRLQFDALDYYF
jgi:hypothetical protein